MEELLRGIASLSFWDVLADMHGALAMLLLVLFGAALVLFFSLEKFAGAARWLSYTLMALAVDLILVDAFGLYIYGAYRADGGPRTLLKSSPDTAWLHQVVFEHKEMLAYAPWLVIVVALIIVLVLDDKLIEREHRALKWVVLFSILASLAFVLTIAGEAVLVTKVAPLR